MKFYFIVKHISFICNRVTLLPYILSLWLNELMTEFTAFHGWDRAWFVLDLLLDDCNQTDETEASFQSEVTPVLNL
jgi:hypothetical protein